MSIFAKPAINADSDKEYSVFAFVFICVYLRTKLLRYFVLSVLDYASWYKSVGFTGEAGCHDWRSMPRRRKDKVFGGALSCVLRVVA